MGNYTKMADLVTGCEGTAYITMDGQNRYFFEMSKIDASVEFTVIAKKLMGHRMKQHKVVGVEGKGTVTLYNISPAALAIYQEYIKTGRVPQISIQATNDDPSATIGKRTVVMRNCIFAKLPVTYIEDGSEDLNTIDTDFTFDDVDDLESYVLPENMR